MSSGMKSSKKSKSTGRRKTSSHASRAKEPRLDRTCVRVVDSFEEADRLDREYWARQTADAPRAASRTGTIAPTQLRLWRQQTYTTTSKSF